MSEGENCSAGVHFEEVLKGRRSIRQYLSRPVSDSDLESILEAARWAPSPHNAEPWRFVVLRALAAKERLAEAMGRRWEADMLVDGIDPGTIAARLQRSRDRIVGAPVVIVACLCHDGLDRYPDRRRQQAEETMASQSLGAAVQNIMLAAHARGLGTCWMCAPLFCPDEVAATLGLPADLIPQGLITLGYPAVRPSPRERRPMPDLIRYGD